MESRLALANDIRPELLEQATQNNEAWDRGTVRLAAPMQFDPWATNHMPKVEVLEAGRDAGRQLLAAPSDTKCPTITKG